MYVVELSFTDAPRRLAARPAHRERLQGLHSDGVVKMAGPYPDDSGAMLVFDVADAAALDELLAADPYYRTEGVTVVRTQAWAPFIT
jgi:uncharacterized protein YciI